MVEVGLRKLLALRNIFVIDIVHLAVQPLSRLHQPIYMSNTSRSTWCGNARVPDPVVTTLRLSRFKFRLRCRLRFRLRFTLRFTSSSLPHEPIEPAAAASAHRPYKKLGRDPDW